MQKVKRYILPLFFIVIVFSCLSLTVYAVDDVSGIPTVSINGNLPVPLTNNLLFSSGDTIDFVSSGIITFDFESPANSVVTIPSTVKLTMTSNHIYIGGILNNYGYIERTSSGIGNTITGRSGSTLNFYYGSVVKNTAGSPVLVYNSIVNLFGGSIVGVEYGLISDYSSILNLYNGTISGGTAPYSGPFTVNFIDSHGKVEDGVLLISNNILSNISNIVDGAVDWISQFLSGIVDSPILITFVLFFSIFTGVGLIKRLIV